MARNRYDIAGLARRFAAESPNDLSESAAREFLRRAVEKEADPTTRRLMVMIKVESILSMLGLIPPRVFGAGYPCG